MKVFDPNVLNYSKLDGLIPAVIQDATDQSILMVGFMNDEALQQTLTHKKVTFWSRSKNRLWEKGETSGHYLEFVSIETDCDNDTVLIQAIPHGPVCHEGTHSCFPLQNVPMFGKVIQQLIATIQQRKALMPEGSYTSSLFKKGMPRIAQKVGEEAIELAIAGQYDDTKRCIEESADLLYHLIVFWTEKGISFQEIEEELTTRMK